MLKKKITKILALMMVVGVVASGAPALNVKAETNTALEEVSYDEATLVELTYAVEEMRIALNYLNDESVSRDYVKTFAVAAYERLYSLDMDEVYKIPNGEGNYWWVADSYTIVMEALNSNSEVSVEEGSYDQATLVELTYAVKEMKIAVKYLNDESVSRDYVRTFAVAAYERLYSLNMDEVYKIPNGEGNYWWVADCYTIVMEALNSNSEVSVEEVSYDEATLVELTYAVEEMRIALNYLNDESVSRDYVKTFAVTAYERLYSLNMDEVYKIPNGEGNYWWVADGYTTVMEALN